MMKREVIQILDSLQDRYGAPKSALKYESTFQMLIATILSAQCTDERVNIVTKELFKKYKTPEDFVLLDTVKLEKLIFSTGFYKNKAKNIKKCSEVLYHKYNSIVPNSIEGLIELAGVGRKTANVVLGEAFNKSEGIVVDTHIKRVSKRLGLSKSDNPIIVEKDLMKLLKKDHWIDYSNNAITHGRQLCKSRKPKCDECFLRNICKYYKKKN